MFRAPFPPKPPLALGRLATRHISDSPLRQGATDTERNEAPGKLALGCWSGDEFVIVNAQLINICQDGILAVVNGPIQVGQTVWLRLDEAKSLDGIQATVLGSNWLRRGRSAVRLALNENCPAGVYEALVRSLSLSRSRQDPRPAPTALGRRQGPF
ncbi:hypothetical protein V5E97_38200 [Singulisphaera sp. Ch08]|uniref:PilZ domain-containing protein n=1 Tax=Singulisphaera sp. Ch08 TaxID=3120278 RepID=A0AAU7CG21_9BACT